MLGNQFRGRIMLARQQQFPLASFCSMVVSFNMSFSSSSAERNFLTSPIKHPSRRKPQRWFHSTNHDCFVLEKQSLNSFIMSRSVNKEVHQMQCLCTVPEMLTAPSEGKNSFPASMAALPSAQASLDYYSHRDISIEATLLLEEIYVNIDCTSGGSRKEIAVCPII